MEPRRIVIIGAGVLGATLAHRLTESATTAGSGTSGSGTRVEVVLLDRERPARGTSRWSLAWLNSNGKTPRAYHDLSVDSMAAWERLAARTDGEAWYRPVGNLRWADDEEGTRRLAERVEQASAWGYAAEFVDRQRVADLEPALDLPPDIPRVAWFPSEGYVLTEPLIASLVRRAQDRGADVRTGPAGQVTAVEGGGTGVRVVRTADGGTLEADTVVCCAGRWTPEVTRLAGAPGAGVPIVDPDRPGSPLRLWSYGSARYAARPRASCTPRSSICAPTAATARTAGRGATDSTGSTCIWRPGTWPSTSTLRTPNSTPGPAPCWSAPAASCRRSRTRRCSNGRCAYAPCRSTACPWSGRRRAKAAPTWW